MDDKKKSLVPALRFGGFEGEWERNKLLEHCTRIGDGIHSTPTYDDNGEYHFINGNNLVKRKIDLKNSTKKVNYDQYLIHKRELNENTILLSINGTIGNLAFYNNEKIVLGKSACYINLKDCSNKYFIYNILQTDKVKRFYNKELTGTTIKNLSLRTVKSTKLFLPIALEQQKIANFLSSVDKKIEQLRQKVSLLEDYKKGVMQQIFSQQIRFKDDNGEAFADWHNENLEHFLSEPKKRNYDLKYDKNGVLSVSGKYGIVNQIELQGRSFAGASVANYHVVEEGDVVYTKSPLKANPYGIIKVNKGKAGIVSTLYAVYSCKENVSGTFIDYYFQLDDNLNRYLRPLVRKGAKNDMKINNSYVLSDNVHFPTLPEQEKIVSYLESLDELIKRTETQLAQAQKFKKGLLQQLFV